MTVDVTISSNAVVTATVNRHGDSRYEEGDTIFIGDRSLYILPTGTANVSGNGDGSFTLNMNRRNEETSTLFDTPDGTRVIPAFTCSSRAFAPRLLTYPT